ncbi:MAG TPA: FRG domain-containing protein [Chitinophagaceae bacterium]|nr:FRG domain-containing protein [Chitinophagaceae bacterium]
MKSTYTTLQLSDWDKFKKFVNELSENWAFRGQLSAEWDLQNAIERTDFIKLQPGIEARFLAEFQRGARNYLERDEIPKHLIEWLALMQHHGAPTRLLDFSKSPFIAAFFAYEQCNPYQDIKTSIWAVNINFLKTRSTEKLATCYPKELEQSGNVIQEELFEKIFNENKHPLVFPVEPFRMNRRYSLQQSIFVSTGISHQPFMEQLHFLGDELSKAVIKIELPAEIQKEVLRDLQRMNLNRASLFPDLDGYAAALRLRYNSMKTLEETIALQIDKLEDSSFGFIP